MHERQAKILDNIVIEYIKKAEPVGSKFLVDRCRLNLSPATIRNEMKKLEDEKYIYQPHTSAGRIPTEKAYRFFVTNRLDKPLPLPRKIVLVDETKIKEEAKKLSQSTNEAAILAFGRRNTYYTGISNLMAKPEFGTQSHLLRISEVIDRMDEKIFDIYNSVDEKIKILIGKDNPFGEIFSGIFLKINYFKNNFLMVLLGPMRMDYEKNYAFFVKTVNSIIKK